MRKFYKTEGTKIVSCGFFASLFHVLMGRHRVAETYLEFGRVSTVFIGFWTSFPHFETAYFREKDAIDWVVNLSWHEAENAHYRTCNQFQP